MTLPVVAPPLPRQQLALYFPAGRYLVSDTLTVTQAGWVSEQGDGGVNIVPSRFHANTLIGATGAGGGGAGRPTIVLAAGSKGFGDSGSPKNVLKITNPRAVSASARARGAHVAPHPPSTSLGWAIIV